MSDSKQIYTARVETPDEQQRRFEMDGVSNIQYEVAALLDGYYGRMDWIARQNIGGYCFVIGKGSAYVTDEEAVKPSPELYRRLASEIMGWELGSKQDIEHRRDAIQKRIDDNMRQWETLFSVIQRDINQLQQLAVQEAVS